MATRLKPLDASWLYVDTRATPMHVASLQIFSPPPKARPGFVRDLVMLLKQPAKFEAPWNLRLKPSILRGILPAWETDNHLDLDYHVRHSALPAPGGERELGVLVSRLHSNALDFDKPLWEVHIIEGLEGGRFALYAKMHHSLIDGVGGMRLLQKAMGTSVRQRSFTPPWSFGASSPEHAKKEHTASVEPMAALIEAVRREGGNLRKAVRGVAESWKLGHRGEGDPLISPFDAPTSLLNQRITPARRFATQQYSLTRLRTLAENAGVTLNDVVLAASAGALRRFLKELHALPGEALTAGLPVSVRPQGDHALGTAISFILANLGTDVADPLLRLNAIHESTLRAKELLQELPRAAMNSYTMLFMAPFVLSQLTGIGGHGRPMFNLAISNVPGPEKPLYFAGAKLEAMYPVSVLQHGQALNITCVSYAGKLNFGYTGCRDTLPHMQRLAVYTGEALDELEAAVGAR
jgi:WS/DGAT/MGAT family acyltransferase